MDEQIRQETPVAAEAAPAEVPAKPEQKKKAARHAASKTPRRKPTATAKRYDTRGARRGQYRLAAWVGLVVLLLACVGTVFLVSLGVRAIQKATDHSELQA